MKRTLLSVTVSDNIHELVVTADSQPTMYRLNTALPNLTVGKVYEAVLDGTNLIGSYDDNGDTVIIPKQFLVEVV